MSHTQTTSAPTSPITHGRPLKVALINRSDSTGGAAVVTLRLTEALRDAGVDAHMLVCEKNTDHPFVVKVASDRRCRLSFLKERLGVFVANGFRRDSLFMIDDGAEGLPLWRHPDVKGADIICLGWINQGMLSLRGINRLFQLGKPIVWTMHDMWNMTGICHHAGECRRYLSGCGDCPLIGFPRGPHDLSSRVFAKKERLYATARNFGKDSMAFVGVSEWMASLARRSPLLREMRVEVIPNAFPTTLFPGENEINYWREQHPHKKPEEFTIAIGAARLDDPVKGLPLLRGALEMLHELDPGLAARTRLISFGSLKNPLALDNLSVAHTHLGALAGTEAVKETLRGADVLVSSSLYETLPGTLVEAQACGAIPVSFDRGGQADIVTHKLTGYLAHMEKDEKASARNLAEGLVWASRQDSVEIAPFLVKNVTEKFSSSAVATRYLNLFHRLLSND